MDSCLRWRGTVAPSERRQILTFRWRWQPLKTVKNTILQERSHLDTAITFMGAFFGMQNCSKVLMGGSQDIVYRWLPGFLHFRKYCLNTVKILGGCQYCQYFRWLLAELAEWQLRRFLALRSLSWWLRVLFPEVLIFFVADFEEKRIINQYLAAIIDPF